MPTREICPGMLPPNAAVLRLWLLAISQPDGVGGYRRPATPGGVADLFAVDALVQLPGDIRQLRQGLADFTDPDHAEDFAARMAGRYVCDLDDSQFRAVVYPAPPAPPQPQTKDKTMNEIKLPEGFTKWDFSFRDGPASVSKASMVEVVFRGGATAKGPVKGLDWIDDKDPHDIVGWRVLAKPAPVAEPSDGPHPHAHLMMEYAKDALTRPDPWLLWQVRAGSGVGGWKDLTGPSLWYMDQSYRRKPKEIQTQVLNGFTVPKGETEPPQEGNGLYFTPDAGNSSWFTEYYWADDTVDNNLLDRGLLFLKAEHAVAVAKAMCGIDPKWSQD